MTDKKTEHMEKRRKRGQTYRELQNEFDVPKSTIHRKLKRNPNERAEMVEEEND